MEKNLCGEIICGEKMKNMRSGLYINTEGFRDRLSSYSFTWCAGLLRHGGWGVRSQLALSHLNWSNTTNYSHWSTSLTSLNWSKILAQTPHHQTGRQTCHIPWRPAQLLSHLHPAISLICRWVRLKSRKSFREKCEIILSPCQWFVSQFRF